MKYTILLLVSWLVLVSCSKDNTAGSETDPIIIEPSLNKTTLDDTLYSGSFLGVRIGASHIDVYDSLQHSWNNQKIAYLQVINLYNNLDSVSGRIPFYNTVYLSEAVNVTVPIQIYFANNQVQSIYRSTNKVNQWPSNQPAASSIKIGDSRNDVYNKLQTIRSISTYSQHFGSISLGPKDLTTSYDPAMARSTSWEFTSPIDSQRMYIVKVFFTAGVVSAIHRIRYEPF